MFCFEKQQTKSTVVLIQSCDVNFVCFSVIYYVYIDHLISCEHLTTSVIKFITLYVNCLPLSVAFKLHLNYKWHRARGKSVHSV